MEDFTALILKEHAQSGRLLQAEAILAVVVIHFAREFLRREVHAIVVLEIGAERRDPGESPAHALFERLNSRYGRARYYRKRYVAVREVDPWRIEVVGQERTALASFFPGRTEHEVIDDQLASSTEEFVKSQRAFGTFEHVILLDSFPRQFAALPAQFIPLASEFLFSGQVLHPRLAPFVPRHHLMLRSCCCHRISFLWLHTGTRIL